MIMLFKTFYFVVQQVYMHTLRLSQNKYVYIKKQIWTLEAIMGLKNIQLILSTPHIYIFTIRNGIGDDSY